MEIEILTEKDTEAASQFMQKIIEEVPYYTPEAKQSQKDLYAKDAIENNLKRASHPYVIAKIGDSIVGLCDGWGDAGVFWIDWVGVGKEYRRQNIAEKIIKRLEEYTKEHQYHKIWCDTRTNNTESIGLMEKLGYARVGLLKDYWYHLDFYLWDKDL